MNASKAFSQIQAAVQHLIENPPSFEAQIESNVGSTTKPIVSDVQRKRVSRKYNSNVRNLKSVEEKQKKKTEKYVDMHTIGNMLGTVCCSQECNAKFTVNDILPFREEIARQKTEANKTNFLIAVLKVTKGESILLGKAVCQVFFTKAYGICYNKYLTVKNAYFNGASKVLHRNLLRICENNKEELIKTWLSSYLHSPQVQFMPGANGTETIEFTEWKGLYTEFITCMTNEEGLSISEIPSSDYFGKIRREYFNQLTTAPTTQLGSCGFCVKMYSELKLLKNDSEREDVVHKIQEHRKIVKNERSVYFETRTTAKFNKEKFLSLIIDSSKSVIIPRFAQKPKEWAALKLLDIGVTGLIDHTHQYFELNLSPSKSFSSGANWTITIIYQYLLQRLQENKQLPRVLKLQLDNCWRENKNVTMLAFLSTLIQYKIFDEIILSFLPQGHTHDDIDQKFSTLSRAVVNAEKIEDLEDLVNISRNAYSNKPVIKIPPKIFNFTEYFVPFLENSVKYHSEPHVFTFFLNDNEKPMISYKAYHISTFVHDAISILKGKPIHYPPVEDPRPYTEDLTRDLSKTFPYLSEKAQNFFKKFVTARGLEFSANTEVQENNTNFWQQLVVDSVSVHLDTIEVDCRDILVNSGTFFVPQYYSVLRPGQFAILAMAATSIEESTIENNYFIVKIKKVLLEPEENNEPYIFGERFDLFRRYGHLNINPEEGTKTLCKFSKIILAFYSLEENSKGKGYHFPSSVERRLKQIHNSRIQNAEK